MSEMSRKDYGESAIVDYGKEAVKRVFFMNTPYSVEATGHSNRKENLLTLTSSNIGDLDTGVRVSYGNKEGVITSLNMSTDEVPVLESVEISFNLPSDNSVITEEYTVDELLSVENLFFYKP